MFLPSRCVSSGPSGPGRLRGARGETQTGLCPRGAYVSQQARPEPGGCTRNWGTATLGSTTGSLGPTRPREAERAPMWPREEGRDSITEACVRRMSGTASGGRQGEGEHKGCTCQRRPCGKRGAIPGGPAGPEKVPGLPSAQQEVTGQHHGSVSPRGRGMEVWVHHLSEE